jgi:hypothetical protein
VGEDYSAGVPRSELRLRERPHIHPNRQRELIVEILRGGEVVGTIYGAREGVHIFSATGVEGKVIGVMTDVGLPGLLVRLLKPGEMCPWCKGKKKIAVEGDKQGDVPCPLCS